MDWKINLRDPDDEELREIVLELLDAALIAPTSCNLQMWDFVVVDDPDQREQLGRLSLQVLSTPVSIFVAYGKEYSEEGHANVQAAAAAMQNMSLAAHALGIGTDAVMGLTATVSLAVAAWMSSPSWNANSVRGLPLSRLPLVLSRSMTSTCPFARRSLR